VIENFEMMRLSLYPVQWIKEHISVPVPNPQVLVCLEKLLSGSIREDVQPRSME